MAVYSRLSSDRTMKMFLSQKKNQTLRYRETLFVNLAFSPPIAKDFGKSALGLPTFSATIYAHMFSGLAAYAQNKYSPHGPGNGPVQDTIRFCAYYRTAILMEELKKHLGYSRRKFRYS
jgi:hypothetical protein